MNDPTTKLTDNFFATLNARVVDFQATGADVIRLDIGSPDLPPAPHIIEALSRSANKSNTHGYQSHRGPRTLQEAWAAMYQRVHGVAIQPEGVLPLLGSKEGVFHLSLALLNPGDVALVPDPGYQTYTQGALFAGAEPVAIPLLPENGYLPDLAAIPKNVLARAKILWLNYPNNPTAALATRGFFSEVVAFARQHDILVCHDAAYTQVTFDGIYAPSILDIPGADQVAIEFNTLSKSHNMAGWRVGAAVGQPAALAALLKLKSHADSAHFLPVLQAATAALAGDQSWLADRNAVYAGTPGCRGGGPARNGIEPSGAASLALCLVPAARRLGFSLRFCADPFGANACFSGTRNDIWPSRGGLCTLLSRSACGKTSRSAGENKRLERKT